MESPCFTFVTVTSAGPAESLTSFPALWMTVTLAQMAVNSFPPSGSASSNSLSRIIPPVRAFPWPGTFLGSLVLRDSTFLGVRNSCGRPNRALFAGNLQQPAGKGHPMRMEPPGIGRAPPRWVDKLRHGHIASHVHLPAPLCELCQRKRRWTNAVQQMRPLPRLTCLDFPKNRPIFTYYSADVIHLVHESCNKYWKWIGID